jgi:hypothetical protein
MTSFTKFTAYERVSNTRKLYVLTEDLKWDIGKKGSDYPLVIPKGTTFDISVPRILEFIQSSHDKKVLLGAAVHDELLKRKFDIPFASSEFRRSCIARGTNSAKAWMLFYTTLGYTAINRYIKRKF